jgi:hypothetical protein
MAASLVAVTGVGVSTPAQAEAYCYGSECVGLNPADTVCANDAITIGATSVNGGMLDLRWSSSCNSAWGRYSYTDLHGLGEIVSGTGVSHARVTVWNPGEESQGGSHMSGDWTARSWWTNMVSAETEACTGVEVVRQSPPATDTADSQGMGGYTENESQGWTWGSCHY